MENHHLFAFSFPEHQAGRIQNHLIELSNLRNCPSHVIVNAICNRDGAYAGKGFIWITNEDFFHILNGKNPDGTERIEYTESNSASTSGWGDDDLTRVELPSLIDEDDLYIEINDFPIELSLYIPSYIQEDVDDEKYELNKLLGQYIPDNVSVAQIRDIFEPYATVKSVQRGRQTYRFPFIKELKDDRSSGNKTNRRIIITFEANTIDAVLASYMSRRIQVSNDCGDPVSLSFYRHYKISQKQQAPNTRGAPRGHPRKYRR